MRGFVAIASFLGIMLTSNANADVYVYTVKPKEKSSMFGPTLVFGRVSTADKIRLVCHECGRYKELINDELTASGYHVIKDGEEETVRVVVLFPRVSIIDGDRSPEIEWSKINEREATSIPPAMATTDVVTTDGDTNQKLRSPIEIDSTTYLVGSTISGGSVGVGIGLNILSNLFGNTKEREEADRKRKPGVVQAAVRIIRPESQYSFRAFGGATTPMTADSLVSQFIKKLAPLIVRDWSVEPEGVSKQ